MKKYLTQRTFNIVGAAAIVWCAISIGTKPNTGMSTRKAQAAYDEQVTANNFLDYELSGLRQCGDLAQRGIYFDPRSSAAWICQDVIVGDNPYFVD